MTPKLNHFQAIDFLRGVAALLVFAHHYYQQFYLEKGQPSLVGIFFLHAGAWGVAIFFVLSGFCIHWGRIVECDRYGNFSLKNFLTKRFFRIYPALFASVLVCYFVEFYYTSNLLPKSSVNSVFAHLTLTSSFLPESRTAVNNVLWSVVVECHFYLLYAVLWRSFSGIGRVAALTLISTVISAAVYAASVLLFDSGPLRVLVQSVFLASWWTWCLGALVAELIKGKTKIIYSTRFNKILMLIALACSFVIAYLPSPFDLQSRRFLLPVLSTCFLYFLLVSQFDFSKARVFLTIGLISYSLYLLHPLAILIVVNLAVSDTLRMPLTFSIGCLLAYVGYYLIEVKGVAVGRRLLPSKLD